MASGGRVSWEGGMLGEGERCVRERCGCGSYHDWVVVCSVGYGVGGNCLSQPFHL